MVAATRLDSGARRNRNERRHEHSPLPNYIIQDPPPPSLDQRPIARGLQASPRYRWTRYRTLFAPHPPSAPSLHLDTTSAPHGQRGPRPPHAQRIPRITRTQSPPRGRTCSVVPLALCARDTSCTCPPSLPLLKTHTQHALLSRGAGSSSTRQHARGPFFSTLLHDRFGDVGILRSRLLFSSLGGGRRGHLDALLLLLRRLDLLEQPVLWRREDLADE